MLKKSMRVRTPERYPLKKSIKKILFGAAALLISSAAFSERYFVCLGSFINRERAENLSQTLSDKNIDTFISEYKKTEYDIYYRVLFDKEAPDLAGSNSNKEFLKRNSALQTLNITGIWNCDVVKYNMTVPERRSRAGRNAEVIDPNEKRTFVIKDSDTGDPVQDANVNIDKKWDFKSNRQGKVYIPDEVQDGSHNVMVTKDGDYVRTDSTIVIKNGQLESAPQISIPKTVDYNRIKIILDWGQTPRDLDSHIKDNDAHIYYRNKNEKNMNLDRDDTTSYGPETITIRDPDKNQTYKYYVHNYSNRGNDENLNMSFSGARVRVYFNNEYKGSFKIAPNQKGCLWHVFDIVNAYTLVPFDEVGSDNY